MAQPPLGGEVVRCDGGRQLVQRVQVGQSRASASRDSTFHQVDWWTTEALTGIQTSSTTSSPSRHGANEARLARTHVAPPALHSPASSIFLASALPVRGAALTSHPMTA